MSEFPNIKSTHSLVAKHVTKEKWDKLGGIVTKTSGFNKIRPNIKIQAPTPANYEVPKLKARDAKKIAAAKKALLDNAEKAAKKPLKAGYYRVVKGSKVVVKKSNYIVKEIGGAKNGGARRVCLQKKPAYYAAQHNARRTPLVRAAPGTGKVGDKPKAKLRPSLTPGTVVIIVAGVHKAKRAVFLKQLASGLCLVTGPFKVNGCPLRRVSQRYLIATSTKLDISDVEVPAHLNDKYFKRAKKIRVKKEEGDLFASKKALKYKPSEQRKKDQAEMDVKLVGAIKKHADKKMMFGYLGSKFALRNRMYPHLLKF